MVVNFLRRVPVIGNILNMPGISSVSIVNVTVSDGSKSSTHYLSDKNSQRICFYRLGSELNFCSLLMLLSATYTGYVKMYRLSHEW